MNFLQRLKFLFTGDKTKLNQQLIDRNLKRRIFEKVGDVLIIHVPIGNLPHEKAEEFIKKEVEIHSNYKEEYKVKKIYVCGYC